MALRHTAAQRRPHRAQDRSIGNRTSLGSLLRSTAARPLRFAGSGLTAGLGQFGALVLLLRAGWPDLAANVIAFALGAQINFVLSSLLTWRDRHEGRPIWRRWLVYHGAILSMALVNMAVFASTRTLVPALLASALGIAAAALGNFVMGDRFVFRASKPPIERDAGDKRHAAA